MQQRLSSIKGRLPSKIVFYQRSSSIKGCLPSKVIFNQMSSSNQGCLPSKITLHQSLSLHQIALKLTELWPFSFCKRILAFLSTLYIIRSTYESDAIILNFPILHYLKLYLPAILYHTLFLVSYLLVICYHTLNLPVRLSILFH